MLNYAKHTYVLVIQLFCCLLFIFFSFSAQAQVYEDENSIYSEDRQFVEIEEGLDSLLISLQNLMTVDSSDYQLHEESFMIQLLLTEFEDFYSLNKNLYLLDYKLERQNDLVSRAILRYWMGFYMKTQLLMDNALELWNGIDSDIPGFIKPDLYLNRGEVLQEVGEYNDAIFYLSHIERLPQAQDSTIWQSKKLLANVYKLQGAYQKEISQWENSIEWLDGRNKPLWRIDAYTSIAEAYRDHEDYNNAIIYLNKAHEVHSDMDPDAPELYLYFVDIALIFEKQGYPAKSVAYLKTASKEMRKSKNYASEAEISNRIASIYFREQVYDKANEYNNKAIRIGEKYNYQELLMRAYYLAYEIDQAIGKYEKALDDYAKYAEINQKFVEEEKEMLRDIYQKQYQIERAEKQYKLIIASEELKDFELEQSRLQNENTQAQLDLVKEQQRKKEVELENQTLMANEATNNLKISQQELENSQQQRKIDSLESERQLKQLQLDEQAAKELAANKEIEKLQLMEERSELRRTITRGLLILGVLILIAGGLFLRTKIRDNKMLANKNMEIEAQHREIEQKNIALAEEIDKSDALLLNILPKETADELKLTGKALPKAYESVSVLFTDFSGFTKLAEKMRPTEVLNSLETMFSKFDEITLENDMERIKTIGDSYMSAGGLPIKNESHPVDAVRSGLAFLREMKNFNIKQAAKGKPIWNLRIGINTGNVVAGVIGKRKFAYDIWGDSVNLASRAESHGVVNKLNITENTYELIKDQFDCEYRGEVDVKNIGKVKMYIVNKEF